MRKKSKSYYWKSRTFQDYAWTYPNFKKRSQIEMKLNYQYF